MANVRGLMFLLALMVFGVLLGIVVTLPQPSSPPTVRLPLRLDFDQAQVSEGVWKGVALGEMDGQVTAVLVNAETPEPQQMTAMDLTVGAGERSFTARLHGTLNPESGRVRMQGIITHGYFRGAMVRQEGQLVNAELVRFQGTIRVFPSVAEYRSE